MDEKTNNEQKRHEDAIETLGIVVENKTLTKRNQTLEEQNRLLTRRAEKAENWQTIYLRDAKEDEQKLQLIRSRAKILIALGACATIGGINKLKNNFDLDEVKKCVYGDDASMPHLHTEMTKAVDEVVEVDYKIHGCPIEVKEFASIIRALLIGKIPEIPEHPVCVECKAKGNPCLWEYGQLCLGPIIRAGCEARCPSAGARCIGCRGYIDNPNVDAAKDVIEKYGLNIDDLQSKMILFGSKQGVKL